MTNINPHDWETIAPHYAALEREELTSETVGGWLTRWSDLERAVREAGARASRAKSEDTTDQEAERVYLHFIQEISPKASVAAQALKTKLLAVDGWTPGPDETQMMKRLRAEADLFREENVPLQAEIATVANEYDKRTGVMVVTLDGEELTLQQAESRLNRADRAKREEAWHAVQNRWLEDDDALDELYLQLLAKRRQLAKNAGLSDYREFMWRALKRFDYTPQDSLAFGDAIESEIVPLTTRLLEERRASLGLDTLRPWDLSVDTSPDPPLSPFTDPADLEAVCARMLTGVDPELGGQFEKIRSGFLDLGSRKGKAPGGYCSFFPVTGLPYIFMNAVGTHSDVQTLLHEAGHAFHGLASHASQPLLWNTGGPMEFNEVASMAMEMLAMPYFEKANGGFYTQAEADRARREHLEKTMLFLPYMAVVDGFQHWVYADAPDNVTAEQLDAQWDQLWARFMPVTDWTGLEAERKTGWHRKLHIFQVPFYYVEYGLAQLGALQVWRNALTNQADALAKYRAALSLGNTRPLPELYAAAGAKLVFDKETVGELAHLVSRQLEN